MYVFALTASQILLLQNLHTIHPVYKRNARKKVFGALLIAFTTRRMKTNVVFIDPHLLHVHCGSPRVVLLPWMVSMQAMQE